MKKAKENSKTQIVRCPDCNNIFAAYLAPHCYTDAEWARDLRKYAKQGMIIDTVNTPVTIQMCTCVKKAKARKKADDQPSLFPEQ